MTNHNIQVTLCGGGNAVHVAIGQWANKGVKVNVFAPFGDEAERLAPATKDGVTVTDVNHGTEVKGRLNMVSKNAADVIPGSKLVIIPLPSFAHVATLKDIGPHLDDGCFVGVFPGQGGFDFKCFDTLGSEKLSKVTIFGSDKLPWNCRIKEYGKSVELFGSKSSVGIGAIPPENTKALCASLEEFMGAKMHPLSDFLVVTMTPANQIIHPGRLFGLYAEGRWDGQPLKENPLFYEGMDDVSAGILDTCSKESLEVAKALEKQVGVDMSDLLCIQESVIDSYGDEIEDRSTVKSVFSTNHSFFQLRSPCKTLEDGTFMPDFNMRYLTEDIPYGQCVLKGLADLVSVETPTINKIITWAQEKLGKEYLVDGHLKGKDAPSTGAPQAFGITSVESFKAMLMEIRHGHM